MVRQTLVCRWRRCCGSRDKRTHRQTKVCRTPAGEAQLSKRGSGGFSSVLFPRARYSFAIPLNAAMLRQRRASNFYEESLTVTPSWLMVLMKPVQSYICDFLFAIFAIYYYLLFFIAEPVTYPKSQIENHKSRIANLLNAPRPALHERDRGLRYRALRAARSQTDRPSRAL